MKNPFFIIAICCLIFDSFVFAKADSFFVEPVQKEEGQVKNKESGGIDMEENAEINKKNKKNNKAGTDEEVKAQEDEFDVEEYIPDTTFITPKDGSKIKGEIKIKLKAEKVSLVEFYLRRPEPLDAIYLGSGVFSDGKFWTYQWDSTDFPNGECKIYSKITNQYGGYLSQEIKVYIENKIEKNIEKEEKLKKGIEETEEKIQEEEEKIIQDQKKTKEDIKKDVEKTVEEIQEIGEGPQRAVIELETKKGTEESKEQVEQKVEKITEKVKQEQQFNHEIKKQEEERHKIENNIKNTEKELENLPKNSIPAIKKEKAEKLESYQSEKAGVEKQIQRSHKLLEKTVEDKINLKKEVVGIVGGLVEPIEEVSSAAVKPQIKEIKDRMAKKVEQKLQELEESVSKKEQKKIEKEEELLKDSDEDGVSDKEELRLKTDPFCVDSDNDGFLDGTEILLGFDPLNPSPSDKVIYQDPRDVKPKKADIYKVERIELVNLPAGNRGLKIEGKGLPNSFVTLHIFSLPIIAVVKTDLNGNWDYILDKSLTDGQHTVYATVANNHGGIEARSESFVFTKAKGKVFRIFESTVAEVSSPAQAAQESFTILVIAIIIFGIGTALVLIGVLAKRKSQKV